MKNCRKQASINNHANITTCISCGLNLYLHHDRMNFPLGIERAEPRCLHGVDKDGQECIFWVDRFARQDFSDPVPDALVDDHLKGGSVHRVWSFPMCAQVLSVESAAKQEIGLFDRFIGDHPGLIFSITRPKRDNNVPFHVLR